MKSLWSFIKKVATSEYLAFALRIFLGVMFVYASMSKIPYPAEFMKNVAAYRMMPYWSINVVAIYLPWIELICGIFLIIGLATRAAMSIVGLLLAGFTVGLAINVVRGSPISCGCFDRVGSQIGWIEVVRDGSLILLALQAFFFDRIFIFRRGGLAFSKKS